MNRIVVLSLHKNMSQNFRHTVEALGNCILPSSFNILNGF